MSASHPIIAITGSSGAGTTSVMRTFDAIFRREGVKPAYVEGDAFHRYDRAEMKQKMAEELACGNQHFSHFGPEANLFEELEALFRDYGAGGRGRTRKYLPDDEEAAPVTQIPGTFTPSHSLNPPPPPRRRAPGPPARRPPPPPPAPLPRLRQLHRASFRAGAHQPPARAGG